MIHCELDHLVVTASSLHEGVEDIRRALGVAPQVGGNHERMGTHNYLLKLGTTSYLEVIAADPTAPMPDRPRWYELDKRNPSAGSRLSAWVARVNDIDAATRTLPMSLGKVESMSRGKYSWQITIPEDGSLPFDGVAPVLIKWGSADHPASQLNDSGCALVALEGFHPEAERIRAILEVINFNGQFSVTAPSAVQHSSLRATIQTPNGVVQIGAH